NGMNTKRMDRSRLIVALCCLVWEMGDGLAVMISLGRAAHITGEDVPAQSALLELGIRQARKVIVGSRCSVVVGPVAKPSGQPGAKRSEPGGFNRGRCVGRQLLGRGKALMHVHGALQICVEGAIDCACDEFSLRAP